MHPVCKCRYRNDVFIDHSHKGLNEHWDRNYKGILWDVLSDLLPLKHLVPIVQCDNSVQCI